MLGVRGLDQGTNGKLAEAAQLREALRLDRYSSRALEAGPRAGRRQPLRRR
jgi:hypothetical protein